MNNDTCRDSHAPLRVVLDTNVALALWVFEDACLLPLRSALEKGRLRWVVSPATLEEFWHEVRPLRCERYGTTLAAVRHALKRIPQECIDQSAASRSSVPVGRLRCKDPDDQKFIDLALAARVPWLLSRDRAVLKLKRPAALVGLMICTPQVWVSGVTDSQAA